MTGMILKQYFLGCLAHASYLVGDEKAGVAAVVDPQRDVEQYLADAKKLGVKIEHVFLTHFHADFLAGHLELRERCGATIHLGARAKADYAFHALRDGESVALGAVTLRALETPGHTPEGVSLLVFPDAAAVSAKAPHAVFTGDTLFIGDVGRPDLMASVGITASELAGMLYDSLREKLLTLPDETLVYPAHGAGSACGKNMSKETFSTLGEQRRLNYALKPMTREAFVALVTADQPEAPAYFAYDADLNRRERPTLEANLEKVLRPLSLEDVLRMKNQGAQVIDVRDPGVFAKGHLASSLSFGLGGKFASWAGTLLDRDRPIVIVADPGTEGEAAMRLGRIGLDRVAGYLEGGFGSVRRELVARNERIDAAEAARRLSGPNPPTVVDVRAEREWRASHIEGSLNIPLNVLEKRLADVPRGKPLVIQCQTGYRSSIAASILARHGIEETADLEGGIVGWEKAKHATTSG
jgi:glyoxylase-like metal-dependent hydrolase (beta-lactamase superfamily II)/rhodanese-related sulfurtransferase